MQIAAGSGWRVRRGDELSLMATKEKRGGVFHKAPSLLRNALQLSVATCGSARWKKVETGA